MSRTVFLSRLIGLFMLIVSIIEMLHKPTMISLATEIMSNQALMLVCGALSILGGLAIVLSHNIWRGGAAPIVITLIGWLLLLKGIALTFLTSGGIVIPLGTLHYAECYYGYALVPFLIGLYLTFAGFSSKF